MPVGAGLAACEHIAVYHAEIVCIHAAGVEEGRYFGPYPRGIIFGRLNRGPGQGNDTLGIEYPFEKCFAYNYQVLRIDGPNALALVDGIYFIYLGTHKPGGMRPGYFVQCNARKACQRRIAIFSDTDVYLSRCQLPQGVMAACNAASLPASTKSRSAARGAVT